MPGLSGVSLRCEEKAQSPLVAILRGDVHGRDAPSDGTVRIRLAVEQHLDRFDASLLNRDEQCRRRGGNDTVRHRLGTQQQLHDIFEPALGRHKDWEHACESRVARAVWVCLVLQQGAHHIRVAVLSGQVSTGAAKAQAQA